MYIWTRLCCSCRSLLAMRFPACTLNPLGCQESFDELVVYFALSLEHGQDLGVEDFIELLRSAFELTIGGPVRSEQAVGFTA